MLGSYSLNLVVLLVLLGIALLPILSVVPLTGALVRWRADYRPKGLKVNNHEEDGIKPTRQRSTGYWSMLRLMYNVEGLGGMYKGTIPCLLQLAVSMIYAVVFYGNKQGLSKTHESGWTLAIVHEVALTVLTLPLTVLAYRSMVTPHLLGWNNPRQALHVLLSPSERQRPWLLFLLPGLLITMLLSGGFTLVQIAFLRGLAPALVAPQNYQTWAIAFWVTVWLACTALLSVLHVMVIRLAIQKHGEQEADGYGYDILKVGDGDKVRNEVPPEYTGEVEGIIELRSQLMDGPYTSIWDCAIKMVKEEGYMVLGRGAWATVLGGIAVLAYL